ncbi:uncharacterized protein [Typha latifolia]|uniref:uncharacterized protein n=1 Tax=Typha latifolia TaxID=4733 RepID=UPI003C2C609B
MPTPWKKATAGSGAGLTRFVSGLRSDGAGSLVVQTGFPTSLADIVVKNRARLKKPSRTKKKSASSPTIPDGGPAAPVRSPSVGGDALVAASEGDGANGGFIVPNLSDKKDKGDNFRLKFEFILLAKVFALVLLAIGRKKLVVGITLSAFALLLLDCVKLSLLRFLKPCPEATRNFNPVIGVLHLDGRGWVSPIREVGMEIRVDSVGSDSMNSICLAKCVKESMDSDQGMESLMERRNLDGVNVNNSKTKNFLRKIFSKKFHRSRKGKDGKQASLHSSNSVAEGEEEIEAITGEEDDVQDGGDGGMLSLDASTKVAINIEEQEVELNRENALEAEITTGASRLLLFFVVILVGLMGGKAMALALTMLSCMSVKPVETGWKKWNMKRFNSAL